MSASGNTPPSYGAVAGNEEPVADFDPRYLEERPLTTQEKLRKCVTLGVPILVAFFIIGGFAWLLTHDFGNLYPKPGGGGGDPYYIRHDYNPPRPGIVPPPPSPKTTFKTPVVSPTTTVSTGKGGLDSANCVDYETCNKLGLTGFCCPTKDGTMLGCCK